MSASISAHTQMRLCRLGERKHAVCASREEGCLSFAPVDLVHQQRRHRSQTAAVLLRVILVCVSVFGECCNRDCDESGKALVFVTITIRSHGHVVRPEVCTSG